MKLHIFSDLHREFGAISFPADVTSGALAELVLLAGDIDVKRRAVTWAARTFIQPIAMVGGNHESYQDSLYAMIAESRKQAEAATLARGVPVRYLERETWHLRSLDGTPIRILGATLWTDFELFGLEMQRKAISHAYETLNDYLYVKLRGELAGEKRRLEPADTISIHRQTKEFLQSELSRKFDGVTIVMTHHAPSQRSLPLDDRADLIAACYASSLDNFIEEFQPQLWVHGHIHISNDYRIGATRILSNPKGYGAGHENPQFDPALVVEI